MSLLHRNMYATSLFKLPWTVVTGSKREIQLDNPKSRFFCVPLLEGGKLGSIPACPLSMVTASLDRRTGKSLSGIVKNFSA